MLLQRQYREGLGLPTDRDVVGLTELVLNEDLPPGPMHKSKNKSASKKDNI